MSWVRCSRDLRSSRIESSFLKKKKKAFRKFSIVTHFMVKRLRWNPVTIFQDLIVGTKYVYIESNKEERWPLTEKSIRINNASGLVNSWTHRMNWISWENNRLKLFSSSPPLGVKLVGVSDNSLHWCLSKLFAISNFFLF